MSDAARRAVAAKSTVTPRIGRYVGNEGMNALVDLGDQRVSARFATPWVPQTNEPVWIDSVDGMLRLVGPTQPKPGVGVIETISGTTAVVQTDFGNYTMPVAPTDPMPSSGDSVGISWSTTPWCTLLVDVPDPVPPPPPPSGGGVEVKTAEFRAIDSGSTDRGSARWWTAQPYASNSTFGAWFYGTQIKDTIPAGAELVYEEGVPQLAMFIAYRQRQGGLPRFALHSDPYKAGVPTFGPYTEWAPAGGGFFTPPDAADWFNALKAGGSWWGIGLDQGGYNIFANLAQDGFSGALRIKWK